MTKNNSQIDSAKAFMKEMNDLAEELYKVRSDLSTREERFEAETKENYHKEALLKSQLLERLKAVGLKSVKVSSGDSWCISNRPSIEVLQENNFLAWATEKGWVKPDSDKIKQNLKVMVDKGMELPPCVRLVDRDSISIRKSKE